MLMLAGNAGLAAVVASLMLGFTHGGKGSAGYRVLELLAGLAVLLALARSGWVDRRLSPLVARLLSRFTDLQERDYVGLLELENGYRVSELVVEPGDRIAGRTFAELRQREEGVVARGISGRGGWIGAPTGSTLVEAGDTLVLYGLEDAVRDLDERKPGATGEAAHARAVASRQEAA